MLLEEGPRGLPGGEPAEWLIVQFQRDVIASLYLPPNGKRKGAEEMGDVWKMVSEKLTLLIEPGRQVDAGDRASVRKLVRWAVATGKVVFSSGFWQATADRAVYEDALIQLTLFGAPARLSRQNKAVCEKPQIMLRQAGSAVELEYREGAGKPPPLPEPDLSR